MKWNNKWVESRAKLCQLLERMYLPRRKLLIVNPISIGQGKCGHFVYINVNIKILIFCVIVGKQSKQ